MQLSSTRRTILFVLTIAVAAILLSTLYYYKFYAQSPINEGCTKQKNGYLIVMSNDGFNDSKSHGAPFKNWPVITVQRGSSFSITVCNTDIQPHGFQISYYLDSSIISVAPGQTLTFNFVADKTGNFTIYCSIFCTIHIFMQNGLLVVR